MARLHSLYFSFVAGIDNKHVALQTMACMLLALFMNLMAP